ncbi:hypothetical protein F5X99DRAFT_432015 [Biscogniauxia marginata]|nr:hypothetical protein F5X99DRAFT_432015 [Biscogniauxia marginata]
MTPDVKISFTFSYGLSFMRRHYKLFFQALALVEEQFLTQDCYLHEHKGWFIREMRLRAYQQRSIPWLRKAKRHANISQDVSHYIIPRSSSF